jgi:hypothetical protein
MMNLCVKKMGGAERTISAPLRHCLTGQSETAPPRRQPVAANPSRGFDQAIVIRCPTPTAQAVEHPLAVAFLSTLSISMLAMAPG